MIDLSESKVDLVETALAALEKLGPNRACQVLQVDPDEFQEMLLGNLDFPDAVVERLMRVDSIMETGRQTVDLEGPVETAIPEASRAEGDLPEAVAAPESGEEKTRAADRRKFDLLKADLYAARLIAFRNLKDLRLRDDEILSNQIVIYEIELTIILDFQDSVPVPGLGWTELQMHEETQRRTRELRAAHSALQKYDRTMGSILRRWVNGRRRTPREMLNDMLQEADALHRAGIAERAESPQDLLQRVLAPAGLDADAVRRLLDENRD